MQNTRLLTVAALAAASAVFVFAACSSGGTPASAELTISFDPGAIDNLGMTTIVKVEGTDDLGKPGAGTVKITSSAGSLKGDGATVTLDAKGQATTMFSCNVATDAKCVGTAKITADWTRTGAGVVSNFRTISLEGPGGQPDIKTVFEVDPTWKVIGSAAPPNADWVSSATFDDSAWSFAQVVGPRTATSPFLNVWDGPTTTSGSDKVWFRKVVVLPASLSSAELFAECNDDMEVWLNNNQVINDSDLKLTTTTLGDVRGRLKAGLNVLAATCKNITLPERGFRMGLTLVSKDPIMGGTDGGSGGGSGGGAGGGGGGSGGGAGGGSAGGGAGGGSGVDAGVGSFTLVTSRPKIYLNVGDSAALTATLIDNGVPGAPLQNQPITFTTSLGAVDAGPAPVQTNAQGVVNARFTETGTGGMATITALHPPSGRTAQTIVEVLTVQQIAFVSTTCNNTACSVMGIKGSGFNEVAQVKFKVTDTGNNPVSGVTVSFSINMPPSGTTVSPVGITNAQGEATANVSAGANIGSFAVHALVVGAIQTDSQTIGIRGAKPTNNGFTFKCAQINLDAYHSPIPPLGFQPICTFKLVDRFNNPVGTGTSVNFKTEAGSIPNAQPSTAFIPPNGVNEGYGTVVFDTLGGTFPATNVTPLPADPAQYPFARAAEPSRVDGALTRNPRDGLVSIIAYVQGEEYFVDANANGVRDTGEQFYDQGEPLVDNNDNGVYDPGETYIDSNANGMWDGPNGMWDATTSVWSETRVLYTNYSEPGLGFFIPSGYNVGKGSQAVLQIYTPDLNLNRPQAPSTSFSATHSAAKGAVSVQTGSLQDSFGFEMDQYLLDAATGGVCTPSTPICRFKYLFGNWGRGYIGTLTVTGAAPTDTTPATGDVATVTITTNGTSTLHAVTGTIQ